MTPASQSLKVGLALFGGGSRGAVEVGFYKAREELRVKIDFITACSIGALNGAFIASGFPADDLANLWKEIQFNNLFSFNWGALWSKGNAIYRSTPLQRILRQHLPVKRFEELKIPLSILGLDLKTGATVRIESGDLIEAILASIALPGILAPMQLGAFQVVDGGLAEETPLHIAAEEGVDVILLMLTRRCGARVRPSVTHIFSVLTRSFEILLESKCMRDISEFREAKRCLVLLEPEQEFEVGLLDFSRTEELIRCGYACALEKLSGFPFCEINLKHSRANAQGTL